MKTVTVEDLEAMVATGCQTPGCAHTHGPITDLFLNQRCHPAAGLKAWYQQGSGVVVLQCASCRKPVVAVAVAKLP